MVYHGYDVYELLGVEADAPVPEIKQAYRWLQKRCHPDIAGPFGHDMAILLNDACATLSNPRLRAIYDVICAGRAASGSGVCHDQATPSDRWSGHADLWRAKE